ncbi:hypothetical protein MRX96_020906 [Rhipicephalus microplus]
MACSGRATCALRHLGSAADDTGRSSRLSGRCPSVLPILYGGAQTLFGVRRQVTNVTGLVSGVSIVPPLPSRSDAASRPRPSATRDPRSRPAALPYSSGFLLVFSAGCLCWRHDAPAKLARAIPLPLVEFVYRIFFIQKLPLDNRVFQSASLLNWQSTNVESEVRALKYLVSQLPQVIKHEEVSSAIDEWHMLKCDSNSDLLALGGERIDVRWGKIFELKSPGGQPKYPLLSRLVKCLLCLPHGNADCERGFSENKRFYENRYSLCIASINGLRQTKTYLRRYDGDATKVPLSTELLQSVRRSRARYTERTASAQQSESRKRLGDQDTGADVDEKRLRKNLEEKVTSSRALLKRAEDIISSGLRSKSLEQVEAGQTLLAEGNSALSQTLSQLEELSKKVSKRT